MSHRSRGGFSFSISVRISSASAGDLGAVARQGQHRRHLGLDLGASDGIAGDRPRPGQRHMLPGPGVLALVLPEGVDMGRDRSLVAGRPQAQVEFVEHALGRRRGHGRDQALRHARVIMRRRERLFAVGFLGVRHRGRRAG